MSPDLGEVVGIPRGLEHMSPAKGHQRPAVWSCVQTRLHALNGRGFRPFAVADLLGTKLSSANAATPAWRCEFPKHQRWLRVGASGSHQFATAVWTLSLNHKL